MSKTNKIISIGWTGIKRCYLNVPKEEAIRRYCESDGISIDKFDEHDSIEEFEFIDEFGAYSIYATRESLKSTNE